MAGSSRRHHPCGRYVPRLTRDMSLSRRPTRYIQQIQVLHAPDEEIAEILQMETAYDEYLVELEQKEEARIIDETYDENETPSLGDLFAS